MRLVFLFFLCLLSTQAHIKCELQLTHYDNIDTSSSSRLPTLTSVTKIVRQATQWMSDTWWNILAKLGLRATPALLKKLYATRTKREQKMVTQYLNEGIPDQIAQIAGRLDRMEQDFTECKKAANSELDPTAKESFEQEINRIDDEIDIYMDSVQPVIDTYEAIAYRKRNAQLLKFLQVLQSRAFLSLLIEPKPPKTKGSSS